MHPSPCMDMMQSVAVLVAAAALSQLYYVTYDVRA